MTKDEVMAKLDDLMVDLQTNIKKEVARLINSGAVDLENYAGTDYRLTKILLVAALENEAQQWVPPQHDKAGWKEIKNLRKF